MPTYNESVTFSAASAQSLAIVFDQTYTLRSVANASFALEHIPSVDLSKPNMTQTLEAAFDYIRSAQNHYKAFKTDISNYSIVPWFKSHSPVLYGITSAAGADTRTLPSWPLEDTASRFGYLIDSIGLCQNVQSWPSNFYRSPNIISPNDLHTCVNLGSTLRIVNRAESEHYGKIWKDQKQAIFLMSSGVYYSYKTNLAVATGGTLAGATVGGLTFCTFTTPGSVSGEWAKLLSSTSFVRQDRKYRIVFSIYTQTFNSNIRIFAGVCDDPYFAASDTEITAGAAFCWRGGVDYGIWAQQSAISGSGCQTTIDYTNGHPIAVSKVYHMEIRHDPLAVTDTFIINGKVVAQHVGAGQKVNTSTNKLGFYIGLETITTQSAVLGISGTVKVFMD